MNEKERKKASPNVSQGPVERDRIAFWYLQCPRCYSGDGGLGTSGGRSQKKSSSQLVYFRCNKCGNTWKYSRQELEGPRLTNMDPPRAKHHDVILSERDSDAMNSG